MSRSYLSPEYISKEVPRINEIIMKSLKDHMIPEYMQKIAIRSLALFLSFQDGVITEKQFEKEYLKVLKSIPEIVQVHRQKP